MEGPWRDCFEAAWAAYGAGTIPVGAVVADEKGVVVARGSNGVYGEGGLLAHAEVNALRDLDAERRYEGWTLYASLEPCLLCVGAAVTATIGTVRFAGSDPYAGAASFSATNPAMERLGFTIEGPRPDDLGLLASALHVEFYLRRNPDGHVVRTHRDEAPDVVRAAERLRALAPHESAAAGRSLEDALPELLATLALRDT